MNRLQQRFRTVQGQLTVLAVVYACAVVLGLVIVGLRESIFERYSRETYLPLEGEAAEMAHVLADPHSTDDQVNAVGKQLAERVRSGTLEPQQAHKPIKELEELYGAWMSEGGIDRGGYFPRRLTRLQPDWVFQRLRITVVAGSHAQQARALAWLSAIAGDTDDARVDELANYARRKALRRGERDLLELADAILAHGSPRDGVP